MQREDSVPVPNLMYTVFAEAAAHRTACWRSHQMNFAWRYAFVLGAVIGSGAHTARAAYLMTPLSGGLNQRSVAWGQSFTLDIVLTSDTAPADVHTSAVFQVRFTEPGLILNAAQWASPYVTGGDFDFSVPAPAELPLALAPDTLAGGVYPPNLTDIELGNALIGQTFSTGTIVTLNFSVPANFGYTGAVFISLNPDGLFNGFSEVSTTAGQVFRLDVFVPQPASVIALLGPCLFTAGRRRR